MKRKLLLVPLFLAAGVALADEVPGAKPAAPVQKAPALPAEDPARKDPKLLDGMSILGNQEAPKALVIVPWKSSQLGEAPGVAPMLDDSRAPVDREVFLRALSYYEIRSETTRHAGAPSSGRNAAEDGSSAAQVEPAARRSKS
jgi:hypothetical protein